MRSGMSFAVSGYSVKAEPQCLANYGLTPHRYNRASLQMMRGISGASSVSEAASAMAR